ncbi:hypothetical protein B843_03695 [Corynebacterium vitaeruminis DSM 20294]|uniref:LGFP repeat-containing protein n=1 Tax=Corynebacterium vitaeruminis DSM 20294 TaxID=1224164 RepID=W5XZP4_9CORY|nr:hypothetical protein B843_03695 [Corynebacterium vitaeruminis DSM 20294]
MCATAFALTLTLGSLPFAHAQTSPEATSAVTPDRELSPLEAEEEFPGDYAEDGPFAPWGFPTPPGAESYEVNQVSDEELNPQGLDEWHPTEDPKRDIIPGQMRSDEEEIPEGIDKAEADQAEVKEARLAETATRNLSARAGCKVYWPTPFEVCGAIKEVYDKVGGPTSFLSLPKSNELTNPDGVGKRTEFVNGFIYWHPSTGAHTVSIPVSKVWQRHGWERGFLGYPITSDIPQGNGWYGQDFQGGHVYTHNALPVSQASIQGAIYDKWQSMGAQNSDLGFPISDELPTPDGIGRYNFFEHGAIYWTPQHGAHAVTGTIMVDWAKSGYEKGAYGFPISDAVTAPDGVGISQRFERGTLDGYISVIQEIVNEMPGPVGAVNARQVYEDGVAFAKSIQREDLRAVFIEALQELLRYNAQYALETVAPSNPDRISMRAGLPEGGDSDPIDPRNRGDIFYSDAVTARVNHGHNGIFVGNPGDTTKNDTVEASGVIEFGSSSGEDDPKAGVKRRRNWSNDDARREHAPRLRNVRKQSVVTSQASRDAAASWALSKTGPGYDTPGAGYRYNFAFNKDLDADAFNCSSLVWASYMAATSGIVNLDANGGPGVYPSDVRDDDQVVSY